MKTLKKFTQNSGQWLWLSRQSSASNTEVRSSKLNFLESFQNLANTNISSKITQTSFWDGVECGGSYFFNNLTKPGIFLLFLSFFSIQIWLFKSLDGLLGFRTRDPRMVGGDWAMMCLIFEAYCVRNKFGQTFRPDRGLLHHLKLHEKFVLGWLVRLVMSWTTLSLVQTTAILLRPASRRVRCNYLEKFPNNCNALY